jgi:hypothetical protein
MNRTAFSIIMMDSRCRDAKIRTVPDSPIDDRSHAGGRQGGIPTYRAPSENAPAATKTRPIVAPTPEIAQNGAKSKITAGDTDRYCIYPAAPEFASRAERI